MVSQNKSDTGHVGTVQMSIKTNVIRRPNGASIASIILTIEKKNGVGRIVHNMLILFFRISFSDCQFRNYSMLRFISIYLMLFISLGNANAQDNRFRGTEIRYYGTGCMTVQRGESAILTDPYISNIPAIQAALGKVQTDKKYVELYINPGAFRKVKMVVAGHSHYNHLIDLPYLSQYLPLTAPVLLNYAGHQTLSYYQLKHQMVVVNDIAGMNNQLGFWYYSADSTVRAMAFKSEHQPKFDDFISNLSQQREYSSEVKLEPILSSEWPSGNVYSYVIDFLEKDTIGYRMVFMSSGAVEPNGMFPRKLIDEHPVNDVFISGSANLDFDEYPGPLIDLCSPERVFLIHWERSGKKKESQMKAINQEQLDTLKANLFKHYGDGIEVIVPIPLKYY